MNARQRTHLILDTCFKNANTAIFTISTEEEFFAHGRRIARLADTSKSIPKQTIVAFDRSESDILAVLARRRAAIAPFF